MTQEVKFNATGRWTLHTRLLDEGDPLREKILDYGIMEPVPLTKAELERLVTITDPDRVRGDVHFMNTRLRIKSAYREVSDGD